MIAIATIYWFVLVLLLLYLGASILKVILAVLFTSLDVAVQQLEEIKKE